MDTLLAISSGLSLIFALCTTGYLIYIASKCTGTLKKSINFLALGIFIALTLHSFMEVLEILGTIDINILRIIMPILIILGSISLFWGTFILYKTIIPLAKK